MQRLPRRLRRTRRRSLVGALALTVGALLGVPSGSASDATSSPCPPPAKDRQFCVTISDTDGVSVSPGPASEDPPNFMRYVVSVENFGGTTLTNVRLSTQLVDLPSGSGSGTTAELVSLKTVPASATCSEAAGGSTCEAGSLGAGARFTATFVYTTATSAAVTATQMTATATTNERSNEQPSPRDPVSETRTVVNATQYESGADTAASFVPDDASRALLLVTEDSSLGFTTPGGVAFVATVEDFDSDPAHCFADLPCLDQTTRSDVAGGAGLFSNANPIAWERRIVNPPSGVNANTITALHFYDPVAVAADPASDRFTAAKTFVGIDGVRFSSTGALPAPLVAGQDYFVVGATGTTFRVSATRNGRPIDITSAGSGAIAAERIRIIGDAKGERAASCSAVPQTLPAIHAVQVDKDVIETCVWDGENGWMK